MAKNKKKDKKNNKNNKNNNNNNKNNNKKVEISNEERLKELEIANSCAKIQGEKVKLLKKKYKELKDGKEKEDLHKIIKKEIQILKGFKKQIEMFSRTKADLEAKEKLRAILDDVLDRRGFVFNSFDIYGGVAGLYDMGPNGCKLQNNIESAWKKHFVIQEGMLEMRCTSLTPKVVLVTSGHVEKFTDVMVRNKETNEPQRADKLLEDEIERIVEAKENVEGMTLQELLQTKASCGGYKKEEMQVVMEKIFKDKYTVCEDFNLMFQTEIGPSGNKVGYLRPETAQGLFVNFNKLYNCNSQVMPFAAAQIGLAFRNEISPKNGLLRVREFTLAEIEHFCNPNDKSHPSFGTVKDVKSHFLSAADQTGLDATKEMTFGYAVENGVIGNETLGYFMARTLLFLTKIGIKYEKLRFRQHMLNEQAHYANDCWDAEILTTYGWIECVGHADRSCFDLDCHSKVSKNALKAFHEYKEPIKRNTPQWNLDRRLLGMTFKKDQKIVVEYLSNLSEKEANKVKAIVEKDGKYTIHGKYILTAKMVKGLKFKTVSVGGEYYTPAVIEPSFGIGRILYCVLEHNFTVRPAEDDEKEAKTLLTLPACVAPLPCVILTQTNKLPKLNKIAAELKEECADYGMNSKIDNSSVALGRKYARNDEIGSCFAITVDMESVNDEKVTIRDRDSTLQIRVPYKDAVQIVQRLRTERLKWAEAYEKYEKFLRPSSD